MSKVITFSRFYPAYHPKKGQQTYFVEKIWKWLYINGVSIHSETEGTYNDVFPCQYTKEENIHFHKPKYHTVRSGTRWKVGDMFSPRVWSGKPYASKMITIAPDIEIKQIWPVMIEDEVLYIHNGKTLWNPQDSWRIEKIAVNDGLSPIDFKYWFSDFKKPFTGQIICWDNTVVY